MWKLIKKCISENLMVHRIYEIFNTPLNKDCRKEFLLNILRWHIYNRPLNKSLTIKLQNNMQSTVYPDSDSGVSNLFTNNVDYYENEFVRKILNKSDFIIDAGCNVGNRTLVLADIISGALLIDANSECIKRLRANFKLNKINMNKYFTVSKALGTEKKVVNFTELGGTCCQNKIVDGGLNNVKVKSVEMTTIDRELCKIGNPTCAYIKTDLEGFDLDALMGAKKTLNGKNMKLVKFERWPDQPLTSFYDFFENINFELFFINAKGVPIFDSSLSSEAKNLFAMPTKYIEYYRLKS